MKPFVLIMPLMLVVPLDSSSQKAVRPRTLVPKIARLLGVRVGYNGQGRLERTFGHGKRFISGHPNSREIWRFCSPQSVIETDGFAINGEGIVLEDLSWTLADADDSFPAAKRLPRHSGWLGVIPLGATMQEVERKTRGILPPPQKSGDTWTWQAKGYVMPSNDQGNGAFRKWTAALTFRSNRLVSIDLQCE